MDEIVFWQGSLSENSIEIDRVWGNATTVGLFASPDADGSQWSHPADKYLSSDSAVMMDRYRFLKQCRLAPSNDSPQTFQQNYPLATPSYSIDVSESLCVSPHFGGPLQVDEMPEHETNLQSINGCFVVLQEQPVIEKTRSVLHKLNNELSVASMGVQVLSLLIGRERLVQEEKIRSSCDSILAAIERVAAQITDSLKTLPKRATEQGKTDPQEKN
ncbi:hypothetical protein LOC67_05375 [Stieleria sp. JC731]|uniref:hypothetical protein n=1 Tax=Pirellulaceae TaxID=2691357 RepID=UPI001E5A98B0|nr:hypothetical protein [Stieleria sp. JC731]MCC9599984.1 hypothetical protein [Stieleria sp. JC731]